MTKKKPDLPEGDDGRTIANMNVEGMPWYSPGSHQAGSEKKEKTKGEVLLTKEESRCYTWGAVKAALLVTGVICAGIALFILFCVTVWFR